MSEAVAASTSSTITPSSSSMAFKRRKRPLGVPLSAPIRVSPIETNGSDDDSEKQTSLSETLEELIALRKFKRSTGGIDLDRLNAGEQRRKTPKQNSDGSQVAITENGMVEGLIGGITSKGKDRMRNEPEPDPDDADAKTRRIVKSNNFTGQTNAVDVDKHMMAYIEQELRKRKNGLTGEIDAEAEIRSLDPRDELYQIAEKYKTAKKEVEEGNVTLSAAMLTAIPEVDLGIDTKLKNIEDTEKAKRALYEGKRKSQQDDGQFAADRFYRARRPLESDADALAKARREIQGGADPNAAPAKKQGSGRRELATDDLVMSRFKKRQRK